MKYMIEENLGDGIKLIKFNKPESLNALNIEFLEEIKGFLQGIKNDSSIKFLIFTGEGKAFIAGADIKEMNGMSKDEAYKFSQLGHDVMNLVENLPFPVVAAVNGYALGGGLEFAMACDFIFASNKAKFGLPEATLGLIPGFGGSKRLSLRVGVPKAKEMIYSGEMINAEDGLRLGLVNRVFELENFMDSVIEFAKSVVLKTSPNSKRVVKNILNKSFDLSIDEVNDIEKNDFSEIFNHNESKEGISAFIEKRKPDWNK